ncbi:MAG: type II toxin-antitoxin system Phd/YefM family antitoxin [Deltaproteobacteria bacterium]|nr:type II toxin-antitoxin system Phd/YefM family antitoxin [Deltaproteobacteria bacterium]
MLKKISAMQARQTLGQIMNEVALKGNDYIVERAGRPLVAIISMEKYEILQKEREAALQALAQIWEKMRGEDPEAVEKAINGAVKAARDI